MKLFQLYPKALAHLTCKSPLEVWKLGGLVTPTPRGIRIEAADFADFGQMWNVLAHAGVPERKG